MEKRQLHALLISGEEYRFAKETLKFQRYLIEEVDLNPQNIRIILCTYMGNDYIMEESQLFFQRLPKNGTLCDVVLLYNGHGGRGTFFPNDYSLSYKEWSSLINTNGNFIFINNSCYSGSVIGSFEKIGLLQRKGLVIAASRKNELSYGSHFLDALVEDYRNQQPFRRRIVGKESVVEGLITVNPKAKVRVVKKSEKGKTLILWYVPQKFRAFHYHKPILENTSHPVRRGRDLDYLLYKK